MNIIEKVGAKEMKRLAAQREVPEFGAGDTVRVSVKVVEGTRERVQAFEGVCIGRKNDGVNSSFTVRKISYGEGVERIFPLFSPNIVGIEVIRRGAVRRAKLYYLRGLTGKRARIAERATRRPSDSAVTEVAAASDLPADKAAAPEPQEVQEVQENAEAKADGNGDEAEKKDAKKEDAEKKAAKKKDAKKEAAEKKAAKKKDAKKKDAEKKD